MIAQVMRARFFQSGVLGLAFFFCFGGLLRADPIEEVVSIEERLLKVTRIIDAWIAKVSDEGYEALVGGIHPKAVRLEPEKLGQPDSKEEDEGWKVRKEVWKIARREVRAEAEPLSWLRPRLEGIGRANVKTFDGEILDEGGRSIFRTRHQISLRSEEGAPLTYVKLLVKIDWGSDGGKVLVSRWELLKVEVTSALLTKPLLAREVLSEVVPERALYEDLRKCRHEDFMRASFRDPATLEKRGLPGFDLKHYYDITYESNEQRPALSVVDINGDGYDDVYVMRRWGENRLLVNQGDGTFADEAKEYGLAISGFCSCALFLDFDNDGDQDVFIGRALDPSVVMENREGRFQRVEGFDLPSLVVSATAADYDQDGFIDLYLSRYSGRKEDWPERFLSVEDAAEFRRLAEGRNIIYDAAGAPNYLLKNLGGMAFSEAPENEQVKNWRPTLQSTFADWDLDGDPDLLVTNDYSPDVLYRNDVGKKGRRKFVDVTREVAPEVYGNFFGMGGSWGDYNNDTRPDLYLSAMYSKAGTRITSRFPDLNLRARQSATGNLLFANTSDKKLKRSSGQGQGELAVDRVGWSWGGQFFDPDNDGHLDLYAPTGFFSPPEDLSLIDDF